MDSLVHKVYNEVFEFCDKGGWIEKLKQSFTIPEAERYPQMNISQEGLDILDAVHCVFDKNRSLIFLKEVDSCVEKGSVVLEAGIGTGILSFLAAAKGARVYGIELNPATLHFANEIRQYLIEKEFIHPTNVRFMNADATTYIPLEKADVIISENIYTGMFYEKQVQIMNHLIQFLKSGGRVIPAGLRSFLFLNQADFPHQPQDKEEFSPSEKEEARIPSKQLSSEMEYDSLDFSKKMGATRESNVTIPVTADGELNSLLIYSIVPMPSGREIGRFDTTFLNGDTIIAIQPSLRVKSGEKVHLHLAYDYGAKPSEAVIQLTKSA